MKILRPILPALIDDIEASTLLAITKRYVCIRIDAITLLDVSSCLLCLEVLPDTLLELFLQRLLGSSPLFSRYTETFELVLDILHQCILFKLCTTAFGRLVDLDLSLCVPAEAIFASDGFEVCIRAIKLVLLASFWNTLFLLCERSGRAVSSDQSCQLSCAEAFIFPQLNQDISSGIWSESSG